MAETVETKTGGAGEFLPPSDRYGFGLKIVRLLNADNSRNTMFWHEARSIHSYCSAVRFRSDLIKVPFTAHYYIRRSGKAACFRTNADWRFEKILPLRDLIRNCFIKIPDQEREKYAGYEPVGSAELRMIYERNIDADLLMAYPMIYGGEKNLTCYYGDAGFSSADVRDLIVQILASIVHLHRCGRAHGDIKPENIMVSEFAGKKLFRLTDFGSVYSEQMPSDSGTGTEKFYNRTLYEHILTRTGSELTARTYTDCYALSRTVLSLILGRHPRPTPLVNMDCVPDRWPKIRPLWEKLYKIENLSLEDIRSIAAENGMPADPDHYSPFYCNRDEFEIMRTDDLEEISYGRSREQIRFSAEFDPLMKVYGAGFNSDIFRQIPEFYLPPLIRGSDEYGYDWLIFHAPDDTATGKPPQDFQHYTPKNLVNTRPSAEEQKRLFQYGKKLDQYFAWHPAERYWLPKKKHIVWVNGKMKLFQGKGKTVYFPISYEACFRFLVSGKGDSFDDQTRLALLPCYPEELYPTIQDEDCRMLLKKIRPWTDWIFDIAKFRQFAVAKAQELTVDEWLILWPKIPELETQLDTIKAETVFAMFKKANAKQRKILLTLPHTFDSICRQIANEPEEQRIDSFFLMGYFDENNFLLWFPENVRSRFTGKQWGRFLLANPALFCYMPESLTAALPRKVWVRLIGAMPDAAKKCPLLPKFTSEEWVSLLIQQPELRKILPAEIVFSQKELARLKKKKIF